MRNFVIPSEVEGSFATERSGVYEKQDFSTMLKMTAF